MVIDKKMYKQKIEITFETEGELNTEELRGILENIRIIIEQRPNVEKLTIIRL